MPVYLTDGVGVTCCRFDLEEWPLVVEAMCSVCPGKKMLTSNCSLPGLTCAGRFGANVALTSLDLRKYSFFYRKNL